MSLANTKRSTDLTSSARGIDLAPGPIITGALDSQLKSKIDGKHTPRVQGVEPGANDTIEMTSTLQGKVMLLQGPSSGGKSTFLHGVRQDGHMAFALKTLLAHKDSSSNKLHILLSVFEVQDSDDVRDLLSDNVKSLAIKSKGSRADKSWYVDEAQEVLVTRADQVDNLLESLHYRLTVGDNGIHLGSSRSFTVFKIVNNTLMNPSNEP